MQQREVIELLKSWGIKDKKYTEKIIEYIALYPEEEADILQMVTPFQLCSYEPDIKKMIMKANERKIVNDNTKPQPCDLMYLKYE